MGKKSPTKCILDITTSMELAWWEDTDNNKHALAFPRPFQWWSMCKEKEMEPDKENQEQTYRTSE